MRTGSPLLEDLAAEGRSSLRSDGCRRAGEEGFALRHKVRRFRANGVRSSCEAANGFGEEGLALPRRPRRFGQMEFASDVRPRRRSFPGKLAFPKERQAGRIGLRPGSNPTRGEGGEFRFPERAWGRRLKGASVSFQAGLFEARAARASGLAAASETGNGHLGLGLAQTRREPPRPHGLDGTHGDRRRHSPSLGTRPPSG